MRAARWWLSARLAAVGALAAACADAPTGASQADVTAADLNLLHGLFCPDDTDHCRLPDRVALFFDFVALRGCPDVVTLQEVWPPAVDLMRPRVATVCPFPYELVQGERLLNVDDETVLTRYPVVAKRQQFLYRGFRRVLQVRIAHPEGTLDVYTTHLAAGSDGAQMPCAADCPAECVAAGASNVRECQAVQVARFVEDTHDVPGPALVAGDFNEPPGSFAYEQFVGRGWNDTYLAAGNPECDPSTGVGCTSGRADEDLSGLESPALNQSERIDFIFLVPPAPGPSCAARIVVGDRGKPGEGPATRLFADVPNPFVDECGPLPLAICWPSDHIGTQVALACD
ncbi:MAG TPA: endonuclease/exonuclease/phosphatase family protein [Candidatus Binatia bacterium]|nr:endonuclease/exonuclease/phosphatase family protein [Candidatus Binatia bacterium]